MTFVVIGTTLNWYFAHWKPSFRIDFSPIREMFGFSSKMLITQVFIIINQNLFSVLLGKFYTKQEVGDFSQANNWNNKGHALITGMINGSPSPYWQVWLMTRSVRRPYFIKCCVSRLLFLFLPCSGSVSFSEEFILIAITDKWLASAGSCNYFVYGEPFIPINNLFSLLLVSRGRSSIFMFNSIAH